MYVQTIGGNEIEAGVVKLKDLATRVEETIKRDEVLPPPCRVGAVCFVFRIAMFCVVCMYDLHNDRVMWLTPSVCGAPSA